MKVFDYNIEAQSRLAVSVTVYCCYRRKTFRPSVSQSGLGSGRKSTGHRVTIIYESNNIEIWKMWLHKKQLED
jgi:hypothetical protein